MLLASFSQVGFGDVGGKRVWAYVSVGESLMVCLGVRGCWMLRVLGSNKLWVWPKFCFASASLLFTYRRDENLSRR